MADRELIRKIDAALAAEGKGRQLWYWATPLRSRGANSCAPAVVVETNGLVRPVALAELANELGCDCDRNNDELAARQMTSGASFQ